MTVPSSEPFRPVLIVLKLLRLLWRVLLKLLRRLMVLWLLWPLLVMRWGLLLRPLLLLTSATVAGPFTTSASMQGTHTPNTHTTHVRCV